MKKVQSAARLTSTNSAGLLCVLYKMSEEPRSAAQRKQIRVAGAEQRLLCVSSQRVCLTSAAAGGDKWCRSRDETHTALR